MTRNEIVAARRDLAGRKRRIILNNDGNEPVYLSREATPAEVLRYRTSPFVGSQVDTVFYCTWSSGFSLFTHLTEVGQMFTCTEGRFATNKMKAFADAGVDPLRVMNDFCHEHDLEFFWSMRMNDTHDGHGADFSPIMLRANDLKMAHPEYMIGAENNQVRYGNWTAMDFGREEIRELAFRFVQEVCKNYSVDGVELDFFRHPVYFQGPARGFVATAAELELMSSLVGEIRRMMDDEGVKRGRPFLLAVRAPDSLSYCRAIGLDLERWFANGLVDLYIPAGYIRLNPWRPSVDFAHAHHVAAYPALDESRVPEKGTNDITAGTFERPRGLHQTYRARAEEVLNSGADGVYLYNYFNPESPILREIGSLETIYANDRTYFASYLGAARIGGDGFPHEPFMNIPSLCPAAPVPVYPGGVESLTLHLGEVGEESASVALKFREVGDDAVDFSQIVVRVNGSEVEMVRGVDWSIEGAVDARAGANRVEVENRGRRMVVLSDCCIRLQH